MKKQKKVIYCEWGIANHYDDFIEINKELKSKKNLRDYIIKHELGHTHNYDILHEFKDINLKVLPSLSWFIITHPKTWIDFLPVQLKYDKWIVDVNMITLYIICGILIYLKTLL